MKRMQGIALGAIMTLAAGPAGAQTVVRPGFNVFSVNQDAEIGKQSAIQAEKQLPIFADAAISRYVSNLGARLAAQAPGPRFTYQFKVVNAPEINAFALPGGYIYLNRGLLEKARSEGELAGVMAHEIAHVALRHPTNQASKAYLAKAGFGVLGGLLGDKSQTTTGQIIGSVGGFGLNTLFLKFSRKAETQADVVGSQIMKKAGYDPMEMAHFFAYLGQQSGGNQGKVAQFLSSHPAPENREARVRQEASLLGSARPTATTGNLRMIQAQLRRFPAAPGSAPLASGQTPPAGQPVDPGASGLSIERPSPQFRVFQQAEGVYRLDQPANWNAYVASGGYGVSIVPNGGFETASNGGQRISYGVIVNHYVAFEGTVGSQFVDPNGSMFGATPLAEATSDLVRHILEANPYLTRVRGSERALVLAGLPSLSVRLAGRSPDTGIEERVTVVARQLPDEHVVYMLLIAPTGEYAALEPTFDRMVRSLQTDRRAGHN
jgi:Zn-dependent protease with chaperone function